MKSATMRMICRLLIVSLMLLPFQSVQAGMIGTDKVASLSGVQSDRTAIMNILGRAEVAGKLQALGLDPATAKDRVAAMTDREARTLADRLDSLPAGAANGGWGWALVIIIAIVLIYNWK